MCTVLSSWQSHPMTVEQSQTAATLRQSQPTWTTIVHTYYLHQLKRWYSFYPATEGRKLSWPRHCSAGVQPVLKVVALEDKNTNCLRTLWTAVRHVSTRLCNWGSWTLLNSRPLGGHKHSLRRTDRQTDRQHAMNTLALDMNQLRLFTDHTVQSAQCTDGWKSYANDPPITTTTTDYVTVQYGRPAN